MDIEGLQGGGKRGVTDPATPLVSAQEPAASRRFFLLVFLASVAINLAVVILVRRHLNPSLLDSDEREYWGLASALLRGSLDEVLIRRTLPFPLLLAGLRRVLGDGYLPVQLAVSALVGLIAPLTYLFARRQLGSDRGARLAALGVLFWPPFVRYGATLYSDSFGVLVFLAFLVSMPLRGPSRPRSSAPAAPAGWLRWLGAGALLGLSIHAKPLYLLFAPFAFVLALTCSGPRGRVRAAAGLTLGCLLVVLPWSAYVSAHHRRLLIISANDSETLAGGLNPGLLEMDGAVMVTPEGRSTWVGPGKWVEYSHTGYLSQQEQLLPTDAMSELLSQRANAWIRTHPREVAYLTARKLLYMWGIYPLWNGLTQSLFGNFLLLALIPLAVLALYRFRKSGAAMAPLWMLPIFCSLVACVSWGSWRFRMPADVGVITLAAGLVGAWLSRAGHERRARAFEP